MDPAFDGEPLSAAALPGFSRNFSGLSLCGPILVLFGKLTTSGQGCQQGSETPGGTSETDLAGNGEGFPLLSCGGILPSFSFAALQQSNPAYGSTV